MPPSDVNSNQRQPPQEDPVSESTGEVGLWQLSRCVLVLALAVPGIGHIMLVVFGMTKGSFRCGGGGANAAFDGVCGDSCPLEQLEFDRSFWSDSVVMQYGLVCERTYLASKINTHLNNTCP